MRAARWIVSPSGMKLSAIGDPLSADVERGASGSRGKRGGIRPRRGAGRAAIRGGPAVDLADEDGAPASGLDESREGPGELAGRGGARRLVRRKKCEEVRLGAPDPGEQLAGPEDHLGAGRALRPGGTSEADARARPAPRRRDWRDPSRRARESARLRAPEPRALRGGDRRLPPARTAWRRGRPRSSPAAPGPPLPSP